MRSELKHQLKMLQHENINPRESWVAKNRAQLLLQIKNTVPAKPVTPVSSFKSFRALENFWNGLSVFLPRTLVYSVIRPVAILLVVAMVGTSGWIASVDAAYDAVPGDGMAYLVKRSIEKTQVAVTSFIGDTNAQTQLHIKLAQRRAEETRKIVTRTDPAKSEQVAATVADLKNEIDTVNQKLQASQDNNANSKIQGDVAIDIKKKTDEIRETLKDVKDGLLANPSNTDKVLSQEVNDTKDLVKDVSVKAVEVIVSNHLAGDPTVSADQVKQVINNSLATAATEAVTSKQTVDGAKTLVESAKTELKDLTIAANSASSSTTAPTPAVTAQVAAVADQTKVAAQQNDSATQQLTKSISEAQAFVTSGDLAKAVNKLSEVNQGTKEVEKTTDATVEKAQTVIPMVKVVKDESGTSSPSVVVVPVLAPVSNAVVAVPTNTATNTLVVPLRAALPIIAPSSAVIVAPPIVATTSVSTSKR